MAFSVSIPFSAVDNFSATLSKFERGVASFTQKATRGFKSVSGAVDRMNQKINNSVRGLGEMSGILGAVSAAGFIQTAATASLELDKNISAAAAKFGVFERESKVFKDLETKARELGGTTEFTAGQAAEGLKNLATAGFKADQAMGSLNTVLNLATATQSELGLAADVAGKSLAAFGLKDKDPKIMAKNLERVSDTLNKIITTTGFADLEELQTTLGMSGASAKAAGVQIEEWGAIVGTAVSAGVDASSAGSQLAMALTRLAKPTAKGQKLLKGLGVTVADEKGNFKNIFDIFDQVSKGVGKMGAVKRTAVLSEIFDVRSAKMLNILIDKGISNVRKLSDEYKAAGGTTNEMAKLMRSGLSGMVDSSISAIEELGISIEKTFDTEIKNAIKNITEAARDAGKWTKRNKELLKTILSIGTSIAKVVLAIKAYVLITKIAAIATAGYKFALGAVAVFSTRAAIAAGTHTAALKGYIFMTKAARIASLAFSAVAAVNPLVWIGAAVAALVMLIIHWDKVKKKMEEYSESSSFQLVKLTTPIFLIIDAIRHFQDRWEALKKAFTTQGFIAGIKAIGAAIVSFIAHPLKVIIAKIAQLTGSDSLKRLSDNLGGLATGADKFIGFEAPRPARLPDPAVPSPLVSNTVTTEQFRTSREEKMQKALLDINITGDTSNADIRTEGQPADLIRMPSTVGEF